MRDTDRQLLARWTDDADPQAFADLVARHGAMVLAVCRRIVGDSQWADDLAQDCFLRLARTRHAPARNVAGWLHRVATHHAVTALRRRSPTPAVSLPEREDARTPELVAQWREIEAHVDAAIADLPDELRVAVVGHYLEGRSQEDLARELGLARRTVGYRIERGIAQVRDALERIGVRIEPGALGAALLGLPEAGIPTAWRASLGKVGLAGPKTVATLGGAAALGLLGAGSVKSMLVAAVSVVALLLAGFWIASNDAPPPASANSGPGHSVRSAASGSDEATAFEGVAAVERAEVESSGEPETSKRSTTLTGRCVDERGLPLPGVRVNLFGRAEADERLHDWVLAHGEIDWSDPDDVLTDAQGRFAFRIEPPPPYHRFHCRFSAENRVELRLEWSELAVGNLHDTGDLVLPTGVVLRGQVVDEDGSAVEGALVSVQQAGTRRLRRQLDLPGGAVGIVDTVHSTGGRSDGAGWFTMKLPVPEQQDYQIAVLKRRVLEPLAVVRAETGMPPLRVVVQRLHAPVDPATISGTVVSESGEPVHGAKLFTHFQARNPVSPRSQSVRGKFAIERPEAESGSELLSGLWVEANGYEDWHSDGPIPWGTSGHRIVLRRGPAVTVQVVQADSRLPVERFGVRVLRRMGDESYSWRNLGVQALGEHPLGTHRFEAMTPGLYRMEAVVSQDLGFGMPPAREVRLESGVPVSLTIEVPAIASRTVEVVDAEGQAASGVEVLLTDHPFGLPITLQTRVAETVENGLYSSPDCARLVCRAATDANGRCVVRGSARTRYVLLLGGGGHVPQIVQDVLLDAEESLRVELPGGAVLTGTVKPLDVIQQLRDEFQPPTGFRDADVHRRVGVRLRRAGESKVVFPPSTDSPQSLDAEGRFELKGIPEGTWNVMLCWTRSIDERMSGTRSRVVATGIPFLPGSHRQIDVDLEFMRCREFTFHVRLAQGAVPTMIDLKGTPLVAGAGDEPFSIQVRPDESGTARALLPTAHWTSKIQAHVGGEWLGLPGPEITTGPTASDVIEITLPVGRRLVRVLRPDGTDAVSIQLDPCSLPTDEHGQTTVYGSPGPVRIRTRYAPLQDPMKAMSWKQQHPERSSDDLIIHLGEIALHEGDAEEVVLRLPEAWLHLPD